MQMFSIVLESYEKNLIVEIPQNLIAETYKGLPEEHREIFLSLSKLETVPLEELLSLGKMLVEYSHGNKTELGRVARSRDATTGMIIDGSSFTSDLVLTTCVLALAIQRLETLSCQGSIIKIIKGGY
jgi:hypothetical protein